MSEFLLQTLRDCLLLAQNLQCNLSPSQQPDCRRLQLRLLYLDSHLYPESFNSQEYLQHQRLVEELSLPPEWFRLRDSLSNLE